MRGCSCPQARTDGEREASIKYIDIKREREREKMDTSKYIEISGREIIEKCKKHFQGEVFSFLVVSLDPNKLLGDGIVKNNRKEKSE